VPVDRKQQGVEWPELMGVGRGRSSPLRVGAGRGCCLGGAAVRRRTRDRKVAGSTPGRGAIKSTR